MIDNSKEYILCAAIWYDDGISRDDEKTLIENGDIRKYPAHFYGATFQNENIKTGYVICQWRHGNVIAIKPTNPTWNPELKDTVQGFMTSNGRFVDRWQAAFVAMSANQSLTENYKTTYMKKGMFPHITCGEIDYITMDNGDKFDVKEFMNSVPTDDRFSEHQPFNMMYSENFY